ncbi:dTDP-glucose 4,6-dehydratase [Psychrobacillus sp. FSL K6-1415]|uniref:dTDP-glucose 4,6-dehydratase n=1 Tax=Psychrobacillus sp. FSL K6-1415 TaxID=2921544 RepID=UPI0030F74984
MKTVLVTGGAGFIGSNFVPYFVSKYKDYFILNLDVLTYAGNLSNLNEVTTKENYKFIQGDIRDNKMVTQLFEQYDIHHVVHFAAESHVDNSIKNPSLFAETNVLGTLNLLEAARTHWQVAPFLYKDEYLDSRFMHISTDEVYGTLGTKGFFTENTPYAPNSPYSASKASSDMIVRSYFHTYGLNVVTTNCSNNYGPKQHDEKLIPTLIRNAIKGDILPIYGSGVNIRDWLYVEDHCKAIDLVFHHGKLGDTYLVGGKNELTNLEIAHTICEYLDKRIPKSTSYKGQIQFVEDRHGHDFRYAINAHKLESELGWRAEETFDTGIVKTIEWYIEKYSKKDV